MQDSLFQQPHDEESPIIERGKKKETHTDTDTRQR